MENRPTEPEELAPFRCSRTELQEDDGGATRAERRGEREGFRSSSGGDAVSILFVHANYSSSVTLLEIEGTGTPPSSVLPVPLAVPANLSRSFRVLFAHLLGPFSFLPARSSLPCPGGFLMDPDHAALPPPPCPSSSCVATLLFFLRRGTRSLYRFQKTLRRILISRQFPLIPPRINRVRRSPFSR